MKITVTGVGGVGRGLDLEVKNLVAKIVNEVYVEARNNTPVKTGNARRGWRKDLTSPGASVTNTVPYIERLEAGASKQAPKGIIGPTLSQIKGKYK